jgi:hypothetical protein
MKAKMNITKFSSIFLGLIAMGIISSCATSRLSSMNNMVAIMEVKEPIQGVCNNAYVIAILPLPGNGQISANAPKSDEEITKELNSKVSFLKDKPDYEDKGMVSLIINCKGELVKCEIDNKTKSPVLDNQIVAVFAEMKIWTPGKINNNPVDTVVLYSFTIVNGEITLN